MSARGFVEGRESRLTSTDMKILYVNSKRQQLGVSKPYNFDSNIKIGDIVSRKELWDKPWGSNAKIGKRDKKISKIEIEDNYIFCTLK